MTATTNAPTRRAPRASSLAVFAVFAALAALALRPSTAKAQTAARAATSSRTAAIVVRSLSYDRGLRARSGAHTDLVVLTTPERVVDETTVFSPLQSIAVQGMPLVVSTAAPATVDELRGVLATRHAEAVFVDALDPALNKALRALARERGIVVFADRREALDGVAQVVVVPDGDRARIVISLPELRAARIDLAADLLKLAEVVR